MRLKDKIAVVTGAGSGIGREAAKVFAREGATVLMIDLNPAGLDETKGMVEAENGKAHGYICDISDWSAVEKVFDSIKSQFGGIDVLYNNASVFWGQKDNRIDVLEPEVFQRIISINLFGTMNCTKAAIPLMRVRGGGSIISTGSSCGVIGIPDCDAYSASKGATISLTRAWAVEYGPEHIRANCIAPAAILTPMVYESDLNKPTFDEQKFLTSGTPLRRWGTPEDIANIALFLASEESSYLNGAIIVADGGITVS